MALKGFVHNHKMVNWMRIMLLETDILHVWAFQPVFTILFLRTGIKFGIVCWYRVEENVTHYWWMSPLDFDSQFMVIRNTSKTELAKILALPGMAKDSEDILVCVNDWWYWGYLACTQFYWNTGDTSNNAKDTGSAEIAGIPGMVRGDTDNIPRMEEYNCLFAPGIPIISIPRLAQQ